MGLRIRIFICTETYGKSSFKGDVLEVYGEIFKYQGYILSPIRNYHQFSLYIHHWKEVRTQNDLTEEEKSGVWIKRFLKYIPKL